MSPRIWVHAEFTSQFAKPHESSTERQETTNRDWPSPKRTASSRRFSPGAVRRRWSAIAMSSRFDSGSRGRRRCSTRRWRRPARPPSNRAPSATGRAGQLHGRTPALARSMSRSSAGGGPRSSVRPSWYARYSEQPSSAPDRPDQQDHVALGYEAARRDLRAVLDQPDHPDDRRRLDRDPVALVVEADVAARRSARRAPGTPRPGRRSPPRAPSRPPASPGCRSSGSRSPRSARRPDRPGCAPPRRRRWPPPGADRRRRSAGCSRSSGPAPCSVPRIRTTPRAQPRLDDGVGPDGVVVRLEDRPPAADVRRGQQRAAAPRCSRSARAAASGIVGAGRGDALRGRRSAPRRSAAGSAAAPPPTPLSSTAKSPSSVISPARSECSSQRAKWASTSATASGGTTSSIRSWLSESIISYGVIPDSRRLTLPTSSRIPRLPRAATSTLDAVSPAAPRSCIARTTPFGSSSRHASSSSFSRNGLPTWTFGRLASRSSASSAEANVAPWMPSRPVGAPTISTTSPGRRPSPASAAPARRSRRTSR